MHANPLSIYCIRCRGDSWHVSCEEESSCCVPKAAVEMRTIKRTFHARGEKQQQEYQYHQHQEEVTAVGDRRAPFPRPPILRAVFWSALHEAEPVPTGCSLEGCSLQQRTLFHRCSSRNALIRKMRYLLSLVPTLSLIHIRTTVTPPVLTSRRPSPRARSPGACRPCKRSRPNPLPSRTETTDRSLVRQQQPRTLKGLLPSKP